MQKYQKMVAFKGRKIRLKRRHKDRDPETDVRRQLRRQQRRASSQKNHEVQQI